MAEQSPITALSGGGVTITMSGWPDKLSHWFAGVEFYSDAAGSLATPTVGTVTYTVKTKQQQQVYQSITGGVVDIAVEGLIDVNWASPTEELKVVLAGVDVATHVRVNVNGLTS